MQVSKPPRFHMMNSAKDVQFLGEGLKITRLSVKQVFEIQKIIAELNTAPSDEGGLNLLIAILQAGSSDFAGLDRQEILTLPLSDLNALSEEILAHSGMGSKNKPVGVEAPN